jgi:hypothetical protein
LFSSLVRFGLKGTKKMLKGLGKGSNRQFFMILEVGRVSVEGAHSEFAEKKHEGVLAPLNLIDGLVYYRQFYKFSRTYRSFLLFYNF